MIDLVDRLKADPVLRRAALKAMVPNFDPGDREIEVHELRGEIKLQPRGSATYSMPATALAAALRKAGAVE